MTNLSMILIGHQAKVADFQDSTCSSFRDSRVGVVTGENVQKLALESPVISKQALVVKFHIFATLQTRL